jgi:hypothetical protein
MSNLKCIFAVVIMHLQAGGQRFAYQKVRIT